MFSVSISIKDWNWRNIWTSVLLLYLCSHYFCLRLNGSSSVSETYGNPCLANSEDFEVKEVEVCAKLLISHTQEESPALSLSGLHAKTQTFWEMRYSQLLPFPHDLILNFHIVIIWFLKEIKFLCNAVVGFCVPFQIRRDTCFEPHGSAWYMPVVTCSWDCHFYCNDSHHHLLATLAAETFLWVCGC